jgi:hypothetical protein
MNETAIQPAFAVALPAPELPKGEREYRAFLRLLPQLLATHRGKFGAIHNGEVVDSDTDDAALILRVQKEVGYVPIHVGMVTEAQPLVRIPHYHERRPQEDS